jgi:hypothetical protein
VQARPGKPPASLSTVMRWPVVRGSRALGGR